MCNTSFCGDPTFRNQVINTLYGGFSPTIVNIVRARYDQMRNNLFTSHLNYPPQLGSIPNTRVLNNTNDVLLEVNQSLLSGISCLNPTIWSFPNIGHDLPIWLDRPLDETYPENPEDAFDFNKKRIMIISQDPLRTGLPGNHLYVSTVFGLHSIDWRRNLITTQIFNELLITPDKDGKYCCLYLTDYNKLFIDNQKTSLSHVQPYNSCFQLMLDSEINLFKPELIVTWGSLASRKLLGGGVIYFPVTPTPYKYRGIKVFPVYHTNYQMKQCYIGKKGYSCKKDLYVQEILKA